MTPSDARTRRILIVKLGAIGDVVMAIPAALLLHQAGYAVDWVCGSSVAPILRAYDWLNTISIDDRALRTGSLIQRLAVLARLWKRLFGVRYELCACLYYDARYKLITLPVRSRRSMSLSHTDRNRMLLPGRHHTDEYARVMLACLSGQADGERPNRLPPVPFPLPQVNAVQPPHRITRIVLCPGGARNALRDDPLRRWPLAHYVALASRLAAAGLEVVLIGGADDAWVSTAFEALPVSNRIGQLSLIDTLALLTSCDALVTHDTGPLHLAGITSIAIVGLFGPTDPRTRLPRRASVIGLWGGEAFACRPCYDGRDFAPCQNNGCLREVEPETVISALSKLLGPRYGLPALAQSSIRVVRRP